MGCAGVLSGTRVLGQVNTRFEGGTALLVTEDEMTTDSRGVTDAL
jgi:predicted hotdog family 3-hydroxylacyl-ACP dehydratase